MNIETTKLINIDDIFLNTSFLLSSYFLNLENKKKSLFGKKTQEKFLSSKSYNFALILVIVVKGGMSKSNINFFHKISMNVSIVVVFIFLKSAN